MKVTVIGKNIEVTSALKDILEKKISKLDKYFDENIQARVTLSVQKTRHIVEVTIPFNGVILRVEESTEDMYKSIDLVEVKLERKIRKQRTKLTRRNNESFRYSAINEVAFSNIEDEYDSEKDSSKVVRTKNFIVKPMHEEEAVLQMELLGHNFFLYQDANTSKVNVIYKRKDGNYGILEPDYV